MKRIWEIPVDMGAMLDARLQKGNWAIQSNLVWADLSTETRRPRVKIEGDAELWIVEVEGRYLLSDNWELLAGIRSYDLEFDLNLVGIASASKGKNWVDPIVGTAFSIPLSERWSFRARGDVGGFGAGSDSPGSHGACLTIASANAIRSYSVGATSNGITRRAAELTSLAWTHT